MNSIALNSTVKNGNIAIPKKIRQHVLWLKDSAIVTFSFPNEKSVLITPSSRSKKSKAVDWDKIWKNIKLIRSFKGEKGSLSEFVIKDRERH